MFMLVRRNSCSGLVCAGTGVPAYIFGENKKAKVRLGNYDFEIPVSAVLSETHIFPKQIFLNKKHFVAQKLPLCGTATSENLCLKQKQSKPARNGLAGYCGRPSTARSKISRAGA
jgi:hypothetical protein